ncbi:hypothetical protein [Azorhizobium sp. AG788]|uniref:hypothetical protein n=1 Tax=Azorhizobium sp. AG788 TaxID=2183897 RepID=UPI0031390225
MAAQRLPPTGTTPGERVAWPEGAIPHGYDQCEFAPEQCTRDFARPRRPREADEERRLLRLADAAIGKRTGQDAHDMPATHGDWDGDDSRVIDGSSRLYKD